MKLRVTRVEEVAGANRRSYICKAEAPGGGGPVLMWTIEIAYPEDRKNIPNVGREIDVTIGAWA